MSTGQVPPCTSREVSLPYPASKATLLPSTLKTSGGAFAPLARPLLLPSFRDPFFPDSLGWKVLFTGSGESMDVFGGCYSAHSVPQALGCSGACSPPATPAATTLAGMFLLKKV